MKLKFTGENGSKPSTQARRYIYRVVDLMLEHEETDREGWVFGGMDHEADRRRAAIAIKKVRAEMRRKYSPAKREKGAASK